MDHQDKTDNSQSQNNTDNPIDQSVVGAGTTPLANPTPLSTNQSSMTQDFTEVALPAEAEDADLIEKEWVERAKQIVEHTREDPYEQQRALSQMKADYLKKRYDKDIKVADE